VLKKISGAGMSSKADKQAMKGATLELRMMPIDLN
jgi:hypothetical protein